MSIPDSGQPLDPLKQALQGLGLDLKNAVLISKKPLSLENKEVVVQRLNLETLPHTTLKEYIHSGAIAFLHEGKHLITSDKSLHDRVISCRIKETDEDEGTLIDVTGNALNEENETALDNALTSLLKSHQDKVEKREEPRKQETRTKVVTKRRTSYGEVASRTPTKGVQGVLKRALSQMMIDKSRSEKRKREARLKRKKARERALTRKLDRRDERKRVEALTRKRIENLGKIFASDETREENF